MTAAPARPAISNRLGWGLALGVILLVAGVLSRWASSAPDGLERVAEDHDLAGHAVERVGLLSYDGPSALIGLGVVLVIATALAMVVRARGR
ncbi:MAG TPA: PDGLE domain-containing protein [Dermatophilaceae bacterium]|jgi:hypothetical protein|nr:PDGLE domain-containing protein [Dermatophilaceae bacterium]